MISHHFWAYYSYVISAEWGKQGWVVHAEFLSCVVLAASDSMTNEYVFSRQRSRKEYLIYYG
jgi:hypothetical protein